MVSQWFMAKKAGVKNQWRRFTPKCILHQKELFEEKLYPLLYMGTELDMALAGPIIHKILFTFFLSLLNSQKQVASAFEQSLIFSMMMCSPGNFLSPLAFTQLLAHVQRTIFSVFLHAALAKVNKKPLCFIDRNISAAQVPDMSQASAVSVSNVETSNNSNGEEDQDQEDKMTRSFDNKMAEAKDAIDFSLLKYSVATEMLWGDAEIADSSAVEGEEFGEIEIGESAGGDPFLE